MAKKNFSIGYKELKNLYYNEDIETVCRKLNCCKATVYKYLRKYGLSVNRNYMK